MKRRRDVFQAIADPTRRAILSLLMTQTLSAGAIATHFDTARPTVSKHLKILTDCDLVKPTSQGREVIYHFHPSKLKDIADFLEPFRRHWEVHFDALETLMLPFVTP